MINKFCTNCGSAIIEGSKFCVNCGQKFEVIEAPIVEAPVTDTPAIDTPAVEETPANAETTVEVETSVVTEAPVEAEAVVAETTTEEPAETTEAPVAPVVAAAVAAESISEAATTAPAEDVVIKPIIQHYTPAETLDIEKIPVVPTFASVPKEAPVNNAPVAPAPVTYQSAPSAKAPVVDKEEADKKNATTIGVVSLCLFFSSIIFGIITNVVNSDILTNLVGTVTGIAPLAGIVLMIIGRCKYPKNTFLKVVMWIIIGCTALAILAFVVFLLMCMTSLAMCASMGIFIA